MATPPDDTETIFLKVDEKGRTKLKSIVLRTLLASCASIAWLFVVFLWGHVSETPAVLGRFSAGYGIFVLLAATSAAALTATAAWTPALFWIEARGRELLLLAATILILLATIELVVRSFDLMGVSYYQRLYEYESDKIADADLIYKHRPNHRAVYGDIEVLTNDFGMRDGPVGPKASGEFRILALGDSVTLGWEVRIEDAFVKVFERMLQQSLEGDIRVLNAGVGSYNTEQEEVFLRKYSERIRPDAVLLTYVSNDVIMHAPFRHPDEILADDFGPPEKIIRYLWGAWTTRLVVHLLRHGRESRDASLIIDSVGKSRSMAALTRIIDYCERTNIALAIVMYEHIPSAATTIMAQDVSALASAHDIPFASTSRWLQGTDPAELLISRINPHLNARGNQLVAEGLRDFFWRNRGRGLLPGIGQP